MDDRWQIRPEQVASGAQVGGPLGDGDDDGANGAGNIVGIEAVAACLCIINVALFIVLVSSVAIHPITSREDHLMDRNGW